MLDLISKFIDYVTTFFDLIFSFPSQVMSFLSSCVSILSFLGDDVATLIVGCSAAAVTTLLVYLVVKLVVSLL